MNISSKNARFIGLLLLSTLLSLILTFQTIPGFDARSEYFAAEFQKLVGIRVRFAVAIVLTVITGLFATATGILIKRVFQQDGITWSGGAPVFFLTSGFGFFLSAFFGIPVLLALNSAARSYQSDWADLAASASGAPASTISRSRRWRIVCSSASWRACAPRKRASSLRRTRAACSSSSTVRVSRNWACAWRIPSPYWRRPSGDPMQANPEILARLTNPGIIAVVRATQADQVLPLSDALVAGGVLAVEITLTTPNALQAIRDARQALGARALVGVGTVLNTVSAHAAHEAGAQFVVIPILRPASSHPR